MEKKICAFTTLLLLFAAFPRLVFSQSSPAQIGCTASAGSLIINEIGNLTSIVADEYVELVVLPNPDDPSAPVDLRGWIIDDNNAPAIDEGNKPGHIILGDCFSAVLPGTIIVIHGGNTVPSGAGPSDIPIMWVPVNGGCILGCSSHPNHTDPSYQCTSEYTTEIKRWEDYIPMRNTGDVMQVRDPNGVLHHALYWLTESFPEAGSNIAVKIPVKGTASKTAFQFSSDWDWANPASYIISATGSPGLPNSDGNERFIRQLTPKYNGAKSPGINQVLTCPVCLPACQTIGYNADLSGGKCFKWLPDVIGLESPELPETNACPTTTKT